MSLFGRKMRSPDRIHDAARINFLPWVMVMRARAIIMDECACANM